MASKRSGKSFTSTSSQNNSHGAIKPGFAEQATAIVRSWRTFLRRNWIGTTIIAVATIAFFWPIVVNMGTYSPGGDAMFNAWEMRRNQNCILRQNCPDYTDANIYYPNKDTMLYSESQLSAGFVTLPLYWINENPIFAYNLLTIVSFFMAGWFMYLLAKYLSKGNEFWSTVAGLIFAFAPFKIAAIHHLQNLSILCLPLAILLILRFFDVYAQHTKPKLRDKKPEKSRLKTLAAKVRSQPVAASFRKSTALTSAWIIEAYKGSLPGKKYLIGLLLALLYVFLASWVQMVFVLIALAIFLLGISLFQMAKAKPLVAVSVVIGLATAATLPLVIQYVNFSKDSPSRFGIKEQLIYSSSVADYFIPQNGTLLGELYYAANDRAVVNSYNPDSYSYMGMVLYATVLGLLIAAYRKRKQDDNASRDFKLLLLFAGIGLVGFLISLGPLLKVEGSWYYVVYGHIKVVIPLPWLLVQKLLPELDFIRAIGRAAALVLFALCCALAFLPRYINGMKVKKRALLLAGVIAALLVIELMPLYRVPMVHKSYTHNLTIPPVYTFIKDHKEIDNLVIIVSDYDYPGAPITTARAEQVLWAGYHNKNIFNGYSGIEPAHYIRDFEDYNDFYPDDIPKLKARGINYVLVDKKLTTAHPEMVERTDRILKKGRLYSDERYELYKLP